MEQQQAFWSKEVADILQIGESTLRKWCLQLEKSGYIFTKGTNGSRAFVDHDLAILRRMKGMIKGEGRTIEYASEVVTSSVQDEDRTRGVHDKQKSSKTDSAILVDLLERQGRLESLNQQLLKKLDEQQDFIMKKINERDQKMNLAIQEIRKSKALLAASNEKQKEKKGFFSRLFNNAK